MKSQLLTAEQVAERLAVSKARVPKLGLPVVRLGKGKGTLRWREDDVERHVASRLEYPAEANQLPNRQRRVAYLPTPRTPIPRGKKQIEAFRLAYESGKAQSGSDKQH